MSKKMNNIAKLAFAVLTSSGTGVPIHVKNMYRKVKKQKKHSIPRKMRRVILMKKY